MKESSAKHDKVIAFSYRRATLGATKICPTIGKHYYFDMFRSTNRGKDGPEMNEVRRRREKRGSGGRNTTAARRAC